MHLILRMDYSQELLILHYVSSKITIFSSYQKFIITKQVDSSLSKKPVTHKLNYYNYSDINFNHLIMTSRLKEIITKEYIATHTIIYITAFI